MRVSVGKRPVVYLTNGPYAGRTVRANANRSLQIRVNGFFGYYCDGAWVDAIPS